MVFSLSLAFSVCICSVYTCSFRYVYMFVCVEAHVCGGQRLTLGIYRYDSPSYFLRHYLSLILEFINWARQLANGLQGTACLCPLSAGTTARCHHSWFSDLDTGNPNLGPHVCVAGALLAGP